VVLSSILGPLTSAAYSTVVTEATYETGMSSYVSSYYDFL